MVERILQYAKANIRQSSIARELGIAQSTVSLICRQHGIKRRNKLKRTQLARMKRLYDAKYTYKRIARMMRLPETHIAQTCRRHFGPRKRINCKNNNTLPQDTVNKILEAIKRGDKYDTISREHNVCVATVSTIAKKNGLARRSVIPYEQLLEILDAARRGVKYPIIAERFKISRDHVNKLCLSNGIRIKST